MPHLIGDVAEEVLKDFLMVNVTDLNHEKTARSSKVYSPYPESAGFFDMISSIKDTGENHRSSLSAAILKTQNHQDSIPGSMVNPILLT